MERLVKESEKKQGVILNSGPTGSGKTTTLYSIINKVNTSDKKIITIENPVEYQMAGIAQTQIEKERGYDFASGLRAIMRQDPDIILVGEIRDEETAEVAVQAALTGHLVLSTIHANSAVGVVSRLSDLGIDAILITSSVNAMVAQRLVRKLCPDCREKYVPAKQTTEMLKKMLSIISPKAKMDIPKEINHLWKAKGCPKCRGVGYKGRIGIFEILSMEDEVKDKIINRASDGELLRVALETGMITMIQDGILKSIEGVTSLEELQRVTGEGDYLLDLYEKVMVQVLSQGIDLKKNIFEKVEPKLHEKGAINSILEGASVKNIIRYVLAAGMLMNVSDIHIEPGNEKFKVRFRIDGVLQEIAALPMGDFLSILNEIKVMSGFNTEAREAAVQDGRFSIKTENENGEIEGDGVDVRVSIILGGYGDIIVMRLLSQAAGALEFDSLEINPINFKKLKEEVQKPNGIIINTGPTGSGKTTTLYTIIDHLNQPEVKIITVEDPIEYQMEGIIQTQINDKENYTFALAMRSLLRQNPDIMMIGEIRDDETANIAYQAALTGHLVLSTMHTNSAAGSIQRLTNMRIDLSDIVNGTNCFMAQRLVRKLCPECKKKRPIKKEEAELINKVLAGIKIKDVNVEWNSEEGLYEAVGCPKCHGVGYSGRLAVTEILQMKKEMENFLMDHPTVTEIEEEAIKNGGMLSLLQDGVLMIVEGKTTLEEIIREVGINK
jgi:type II secretory ATPase GspE/PulE/Tfp pilus assembly ATPase PilB-like protein